MALDLVCQNKNECKENVVTTIFRVLILIANIVNKRFLLDIQYKVSYWMKRKPVFETFVLNQLTFKF